jgi:hypothetical protein
MGLRRPGVVRHTPGLPPATLNADAIGVYNTKHIYFGWDTYRQMLAGISVRGNRWLVVLVAGTLVATAGCSGALPGLGGGGGGETLPPAADAVPADVDAVVTVDADGLATDETLRRLAESLPEDESTDVTDGDSFSEQTDLNLSEVDRAVVFARYPEQGATDPVGYSAAVVDAGWSTEAVVDGARNGTEGGLEETTYAETTLYRPTGETDDDSWLAILEDGQYVVGSENAVKDAVDVANGDGESMSGELRSQFEATPEEGYVRFAATVPQDRVPADRLGRGTQFNTSAFNGVEMVSGAHYVEGENVSVQFSMDTGSGSDAEDVANVIDGALRVYEGTAGNETVQNLVDNVTVSRSDGVVTVTAENRVDDLETLAEMLAGQPFTPGVEMGAGTVAA